jgi:hypothetical protein
MRTAHARPRETAVPPNAQRLLHTDHWRRARGHKEWQHFCVFGNEVEVLINLSLLDGVQADGPEVAEVARLAILARDRDGWRGGLQRFAPGEVDVAGGRIDARFGDCHLRFEGGRYLLEVALASGDLRACLALEPQVTPALTNRLNLGRGGNVRWLLVPRVCAHGRVHIAGRAHDLRGSLGYHDHNWGCFRWGADFAWDWVIALPSEASVPWTLVATRITDRGRLVQFTDSLLLWKGDELARGFRGEGITTRTIGLHRPAARPLRIPPAMWLAAPGVAFDVPAHTEVRGEGRGDVVELSLTTLDFAQIAIPDDADDDGTTLLSEIRCRASVDGRVRGERVRFEGTALLELVHAAQ